MSELTMKEILLLTASDGCAKCTDPQDCDLVQSEECRPHWTKGSLAEAMAVEMLRTVTGRMVQCPRFEIDSPERENQADAVERLAQTGRALQRAVDAALLEWHLLSKRVALEQAARAHATALEAVEKWKK
jgi:hypothetical protein